MGRIIYWENWNQYQEELKLLHIPDYEYLAPKQNLCPENIIRIIIKTIQIKSLPGLDYVITSQKKQILRPFKWAIPFGARPWYIAQYITDV